MIFCIVFSVVLVFFSFLTRRTFKYSLELVFALITLFLALRYNWGNDYLNYLRMFESFSNSSVSIFDYDGILSLRERGEVGWTFINLLCRPIGFFGMVAILTLFECCVIYRFIKYNVNKDDYWFAIFIFLFCADYFMIGASMMRQWLAICIFILAIPNITERRPIRYILLILIMSSIHTSALILLPLYLLTYIQNIKLNNVAFVIILVFVYIIWVFVGPFIFRGALSFLFTYDEFGEYSDYLTDSGSGVSTGFGVLFKTLFAIILMTRINELNPHMRTMLLIYFISIFLLPLASTVPMIGRIGMYNTALSIALFPAVLKLFKRDIATLMKIVWILWLLFTYYGFWTAPTWVNSFREYKTIFSLPWI